MYTYLYTFSKQYNKLYSGIQMARKIYVIRAWLRKGKKLNMLQARVKFNHDNNNAKNYYI